MLRPYQQNAHDAVMDWIKRSRSPCLIEAATGAGKSHIIAALAATVHGLSGKRVLCTAPKAELIIQNHEKYALTGAKASIFSASAGQKCLRHPVIFGTPGTIKNRISRFGADIGMIVVDECHGITPTIKTIIDAVREKNPLVRVVGLSATPYRLNEGYIFAQWPDGKTVLETRDPYFESCVYRITERELIELGFLTPPVIGQICAEAYDTSQLQLNRLGRFDEEAVDRAFVGHGRKTAAVCGDVVNQARDRKGVMVFAATVKHAEEVMASLPPGLSAIVTDKTGKHERKQIVKDFKAQKIKYLVNVGVFTTGFDVPHVDMIALLRLSESVALINQIRGRGSRLYPGKTHYTILDYAGNIDRHFPDGDLFTPKIKAKKAPGSAEMSCLCPQCSAENLFSARPNDHDYKIDTHGYFIDHEGNPFLSDLGPVPAHFGRRCQARIKAGADYVQCSYRWTFKPCPHCEADNDIAARYCRECKGEIVDPNEKLIMDFRAMKKDPHIKQTDVVLSWNPIDSISQKGHETWRIEVRTTHRHFTFWIQKNPMSEKGLRDRDLFLSLEGQQPRTITYQKNADGFFRVWAYNRPEDVEPDVVPLKALV